MFLEEYDEELHMKTIQNESREDERERINCLNEHLIKDDRIEELARSCKDRNLQEALLKEYHLNR
ncbi:MAG: hypothetical protein Q4D16_04435 [Eubacteriales bacterium]|nr:hypothetical protein [Eubacteriales bacterium]